MKGGEKYFLKTFGNKFIYEKFQVNPHAYANHCQRMPENLNPLMLSSIPGHYFG